MTRGPYDQGDYRLDWQIREDLLPEFDEAGDPFDPVMWERAWDPRLPKLSIVIDGAGANRGGLRAPVDTRQPGGSPPFPPPEEDSPAALTSEDVSEPGGTSAGLA